jgi:hypothetical protein
MGIKKMEMTREKNNPTRIPCFSMVKHVEQALVEANLSIEDLDREILRGMTLSYETAARAPENSQAQFITQRVAYEGTNPVEAYRRLSDDDRNFCDSLDDDTKQNFLYFHGANYMWDWCFNLTEDSVWRDRHKPKKMADGVEDIYPQLLQFIRHLPFEYTGRVMILGVSPNQKVYRHIDSHENEPTVDCIIVSFQSEEKRKNIFVEDRNGTIFCPPTLGYCLDDSFAHMLEAKPYFTYTVRIEGKFIEGIRGF